MNKKTTQSSAKVLLFVCMISSVLTFAEETSSNLTTDTFIREFFDRHKDESIKPNELNEFISYFNDKTDPKLNQENYDCLFTKAKQIKSFIESTNGNDDSDMSSVFLKFLRKCLTLHSNINDNIKKNNNGTSKPQIQETPDSRENWLFAFLSAIIITIIGLLCYLVVPSLNACCFNYLFQFLVALAVGSLCGDALLHLIPHAFMGDHHNHDTEIHNDYTEHDDEHDTSSHDSGVYKGLAAIVGIYVFFLIEKIMHMRRARKEKRHRQTEMAISESENELIRNAIINCTNNTTNNNSNINLNQMPKLDHDHAIIDTNGNVLTEIRVNSLTTGNNKIYTNEQLQQQSETITEDQSCLVIHANKDLKYISQYLPNNKCTENVDHHDHENEIEHLHQHSQQLNRLGQLSSSAKNLDNNNNDNNNTTNQNTIISTTTNTITNNNNVLNNNLNKIPNEIILINEDNTKNKMINEQSTLLILDGINAENACVCSAPQSLQMNDGDESSTKVMIDSNNKFLLDKNDNLKIINNNLNHSHSGKDHSRKHGHSHGHKYKTSREKAHHDHHKKHEKEISDIKLIAWMVLMGDGLHNFSDGLAIGASFASSLPAGFGTAIAVLCHELPHEIGDFAVLRRAGVSLKRALVFNLVSGILCLLGVLVGLLIGDNKTMASWALLFIAGTFLYISLVDMIPELSEDKDDDSVVNFLIQSFGILVGIGVMLAIALNEDKIKRLFNKD